MSISFYSVCEPNGLCAIIYGPRFNVRHPGSLLEGTYEALCKRCWALQALAVLVSSQQLPGERADLTPSPVSPRQHTQLTQ